MAGSHSINLRDVQVSVERVLGSDPINFRAHVADLAFRVSGFGDEGTRNTFAAADHFSFSMADVPHTYLLRRFDDGLRLYGVFLYSVFDYDFYDLVSSTLGTLVPNSVPMYILQSLSVSIVIVIVWLLYKFRLGYTFVPDYEHVSVAMKGINLKLFVFIIAGYVSLAVTNFVTFASNLWALAIIFPLFILLWVLLYYAQRKEYTND
ncbi:hypothetical protein [Paenibacillus sp. 1P07SE]|uniref:hypothetical protein n=1 Tax=Paenibacillus sp. 1P07SE TaxID=3132209 RepID=UPI0039A7412E